MGVVTKWVPETRPDVLRRIGKLGEECAELAKVCSRIVIQGAEGIDPASGRTNLEELEREAADVGTQIELCVEKFGLNWDAIYKRMDEKRADMLEWERLSNEC